MSDRYQQYMQSVQPTGDFMLRLENRMNRELHRKRRSSPGIRLAACAATVAVLALTGVILLRPAPPDVVRPPVTSASGTLPSTVPDPTPEVLPTPTPEPTSPSEETRLELMMSDDSVFVANRSLLQSAGEAPMFEDHLAGSDSHGSHLVEIRQSSELNSVVIAPLRPGTAYWPVGGEAAGRVPLLDKKGQEVGYADPVVYLDENTNTLRNGWKHTFHANTEPLPAVPDNPVERIQIPGKVKAGGAMLRYGTSDDAPAVAELAEDQLLGLAYRVGNWLYASTEPFCMNSEPPVTGWIHLTEVLGMHQRITPLHVDLLANEVNLRSEPNGKIIATLTKDMSVRYGGATVSGKSGSWHFVSVVNAKGFANASGYISAEYSKLNTFYLGDELDMDGVVAAALSYSETTPFGAHEQTVEGEKLNLLLERLKIAYSESVYTEVCGEGAAFITLTYADGSEVILPISGDSCTQVRCGAVTYDLKTDAERTERFLNDGGVNLSDILSPIFDKIKFY